MLSNEVKGDGGEMYIGGFHQENMNEKNVIDTQGIFCRCPVKIYIVFKQTDYTIIRKRKTRWFPCDRDWNQMASTEIR